MTGDGGENPLSLTFVWWIPSSDGYGYCSFSFYMHISISRVSWIQLYIVCSRILLESSREWWPISIGGESFLPFVPILILRSRHGRKGDHGASEEWKKIHVVDGGAFFLALSDIN